MRTLATAMCQACDVRICAKDKSLSLLLGRHANGNDNARLKEAAEKLDIQLFLKAPLPKE